MANIKSAMKRAKVAEKRTQRNKMLKTNLKSSIKKFDMALVADDKEVAENTFKVAVKKLDMATSKGIIHKNSAARKKSSLARKLNAMN